MQYYGRCTSGRRPTDHAMKRSRARAIPLRGATVHVIAWYSWHSDLFLLLPCVHPDALCNNTITYCHRAAVLITRIPNCLCAPHRASQCPLVPPPMPPPTSISLISTRAPSDNIRLLCMYTVGGDRCTCLGSSLCRTLKCLIRKVMVAEHLANLGIISYR